MKGGITSGVIYPMAVLELATAYRFRCIGGASAGAIAAAMTAAAEHGRDQGGFAKLEGVCTELAAPGKLLSLFQATPRTRPLLDLLLSYLQMAETRGVRAWLWQLAAAPLRRALWAFIGGAVGALALLALLSWAGGLWPFGGWTGTAARWLAGGLVAVLFAGLAGWCAATVALLLQARRLLARGASLAQAVQDNHFGICPGSRPGPYAPEGVTDYLSRRFDDLAGLASGEGPLTLGCLASKGIELALMTSNLSLQCPYRFPLRDELFLYKEQELRSFFPPEVLAALAKVGPPAGYRLAPEASCRFLPRGVDLPVVVAVRISLSFPLLFSAVPLYTLSQGYYDRKARDPQTPVTDDDLQRNYFSDGGIVSNFPIHLFDRWLPDWPTFGINLADMPPGAF
jgi:hypothetical protein